MSPKCNLLIVILSVDISNTVFGIIATLLALGSIWATIWATRRYRNTTTGLSFQLGNLDALNAHLCNDYIFNICLERNDVDTRCHAHVPEIELGLLQGASPTPITHEDEFENGGSLILAPNAIDHRHNLHEVIGDALVVFSSLLRAQN